jgi:hypothetical protein
MQMTAVTDARKTALLALRMSNKANAFVGAAMRDLLRDDPGSDWGDESPLGDVAVAQRALEAISIANNDLLTLVCALAGREATLLLVADEMLADETTASQGSDETVTEGVRP